MDIILQDLHPRETYLKWFSNNTQTRPNGRNFDEIPKIFVKKNLISSAEGSAMVNYGETVIISAINSEVAEPKVDALDKGFLVVNFHFAAGARTDVKPGPPSEEVQSITEKLSKIIKTHVLNIDDLCIVPNSLSRVLYIDAICLCDTGFAYEAALMACMIALKNALLNVPCFDEESGVVRIEPDCENEVLKLNSWPCSFNISALKDIFLLEPDYQEMSACDKSSLSVVVDLKSREILELDKGIFCMDDDLVFSKIQPIINTACSTIQSLLDL